MSPKIQKPAVTAEPTPTPAQPRAHGLNLGVDTHDSPLAEWLARQVGDRYLWASGLGWLEWDGKRWRETTEVTLIEVTRQEFETLYHEEVAGLPADAKAAAARLRDLVPLLNNGKIRAAVGLLKGIVERNANDLDRHADLLNVANGVVDLRTRELRPHDPELLFTRITPVEYVPGARHKDWDKALGAFADAEVIEWMQTRIGQGVTGHMASDDRMPILQGGGSNGKSTIVDAVKAALGKHDAGGYAVTVPEKLLVANPSDHSTELTTLKGARIAFIEELPEGARFSVKRLKDVLGTSQITARRIRENNMTWDATHSLFVTSNYRPRVNETDHGTWRRLALVRFPWTFDGKATGANARPADPNLRERMKQGRNGQHEAVLAWVIEGAHRWYEADRIMPPMPASVEADTEEWRQAVDFVLSYAKQNLQFVSGAAVVATELFEHFNAWMRAHGQAEWSDQTFTERFGGHSLVLDRGVEKRRSRTTKNLSRAPGAVGAIKAERVVQWFGVAFRSDADDVAGEALEGGF